MRMKNKYFFTTTLGFSCLKGHFCHSSPRSLFPECPGKGAAARERMEKERAHPFLGYSHTAERSPWLNRAAFKFCQINFLPVVKMTTSGDGIDLKGNKQGNCIFYCQCINFTVWNMNSFSAVALGGGSASARAGTRRSGRSISCCLQTYCSLAEEGRQRSALLVGVLAGERPWPPGRCAAPGTGVPRRRGREVSAVTLPLLIA